MKKLIYVFLLLLHFNSYGQNTFEYEFDDNITLNILEESEEGKTANGKFIKGTFENEVFVCLSSDKVKSTTLTESDLLKIFQGAKDGILNSTKGILLNEETINLKNNKVLKVKISFTLKGENKIVENYGLVYKNIIYSFQFINNENEFEKFTAFRKNVLDSIKFK